MESLSQPIGNYKNLIYAKIGIIDKKAGQMYNFTCFFKIFLKFSLHAHTRSHTAGRHTTAGAAGRHSIATHTLSSAALFLLTTCSVVEFV